jgi:cell division protein FtsZ
MNVSGGSDLGLFEIHEAAQLVADAAHPDANIIFGAVIDDALGDEVRVTVIAAGFDGGAPLPRAYEAPRRERVREAAPEPVREPQPVSASRRSEPAPAEEPAPARTPEPARASRPEPPRRTIVFDDADDLDVPDFLK